MFTVFTVLNLPSTARPIDLSMSRLALLSLVDFASAVVNRLWGTTRETTSSTKSADIRSFNTVTWKEDI